MSLIHISALVEQVAKIEKGLKFGPSQKIPTTTENYQFLISINWPSLVTKMHHLMYILILMMMSQIWLMDMSLNIRHNCTFQ